jgi:serine/threonine protein kinase
VDEFVAMVEHARKIHREGEPLIITMARVHKSKILHNDISPSNILLHFPPDHVDRVYIGVCDWDMATRFIEDEHSMYGYPTKAEMEKNKKERYWVAPELFSVYGPPNSKTACTLEAFVYAAIGCILGWKAGTKDLE